MSKKPYVMQILGGDKFSRNWGSEKVKKVELCKRESLVSRGELQKNSRQNWVDGKRRRRKKRDDQQSSILQNFEGDPRRETQQRLGMVEGLDGKEA